MAKFNNRHYYKIDVMGRDGYSFMISTLNPLKNEEEAIDIAFDLDCFDSTDDVDNAIVDDLIGEDDIKHFIECKCCYQY